MRWQLIPGIVLAAVAGCSRQESPPSPPPGGPAAPATSAAPAAPVRPAPTAAAPARTEVSAAREEPAGPLPSLDEGLRKVRELEDGAEFTEALALCRKLRSAASNREDAERLDATARRLTEEKRGATGLSFAIHNLASADPTLACAAEQQLSDAGDVGLIFLRKALRDDAGAVAERAAAVLAGMRDEKSVPLLTAWTRKHPASPAVPAVWSKMKTIADKIPPSEFPPLFLLLMQDTQFKLREVAGFFIWAHRTLCQEKADAFNKLAGNSRAHDFMKSYIEKALVSDQPAVVEWAVATEGVFDTLRKGLRGSYYAGVNFDKLVFERLDPKIEVPERSFPYPDGRQDEISIRWTGFVVAGKPGKYTFYSASDDGQRVWVDGKLILDDWNSHGATEMQATVDLQPGVHAFKVEYYQGSGGASIAVSWSGPGFAKQVIAGDALRTRAWKELAAAPKK